MIWVRLKLVAPTDGRLAGRQWAKPCVFDGESKTRPWLMYVAFRGEPTADGYIDAEAKVVDDHPPRVAPGATFTLYGSDDVPIATGRLIRTDGVGLA